MNLLRVSMAFVLGLCIVSCKKENNQKSFHQAFDEIPTTTYYPSEILTGQHTNMNGTWIFYASSGGFTGGGFGTDFHKLLIKPNGIFGIVRNDSLLTHGKIQIEAVPTEDFFVKFVAENQILGIDLIGDNEKYVHFYTSDSLNLNAPCCDRYDLHLKRE